MEHVVFFPASDGSPAFSRVPSLEDAVRLVEHLRNVEGVGEASVHTLTEVPLNFRAYYHVEVPAAAATAPPAAFVPAHQAEPAAVPAQAVAAHVTPEPAVDVSAVEVEMALPAPMPLAPVLELVPPHVATDPVEAATEPAAPVELPVAVPDDLPVAVPAGEHPRSLGFFA